MEPPELAQQRQKKARLGIGQGGLLVLGALAVDDLPVCFAKQFGYFLRKNMAGCEHRGFRRTNHD
jgi:hypothetical protein